MTKRVGRQTVAFSKPIVIRAAASTVGKKEGEGPLGKYFDEIAEDSMMGEEMCIRDSILKKRIQTLMDCIP